MNPMQSGLASGSSEIVMCINVVAHREAKLPHGEDNSPKRPAGGMAASREDNYQTAHRGQKCITGRTPINGPQRTKMPVMEEQKREKCITGRTPIDDPQGSKMPVMEEQKREKCITGRTPIDDPQGQKMAVMAEQNM